MRASSKKKRRRIITILGAVFLILFILFLLSRREAPASITYGVSFSKLHADELVLPWQAVYRSLLDDLGVRHLRLSAHWPMVEPDRNRFEWSVLDYQLNQARKREASVILAVGRRLPGWPECHQPNWVLSLSEAELEAELLEYVEAVVRRYRGYGNLLYWQVENEPFLARYARKQCGKLDRRLFEKEVELVRSLDPNRPILLTDSGEVSTWRQAYRRGDVFGTSLYLYVWHRQLGKLRYPITPAFFKIKWNIMQLLYGKKPSLIIELSAEPWLLEPIVDTPLDVMLARMGKDKWQETVQFAGKTGFDRQYLWGVEWWYWMRENGHPEFWEMAGELFRGKEVVLQR